MRVAIDLRTSKLVKVVNYCLASSLVTRMKISVVNVFPSPMSLASIDPRGWTSVLILLVLPC